MKVDTFLFGLFLFGLLLTVSCVVAGGMNPGLVVFGVGVYNISLSFLFVSIVVFLVLVLRVSDFLSSVQSGC